MSEEKTSELDSLQLPIVDISPFMSNDIDNIKEKESVISKIKDGFNEIGFILLKGHNLNTQSLSTIFDINKEFFTKLSDEILNSTIIQSPVPRGYAPINTENFGALIGEIKPNDLNCKYRIGPEYHNNQKINVNFNKNKNKNDEFDNYYNNKGARCLLYPNIWPSINNIEDNNLMAKWKESLLQIYDELYKITGILFDIFEHIFMNKFKNKFDKHTSILSTNIYPTKSEIKQRYGIDIDIGNKQMAISEHTDIDILTIITQNNNEGGVEINYNDKWLKIPYDKDNNYLIVNVGDGLQHLTNNKWKSTKHRVLIPENDKSRQVIAFFAAFNHDAIMEPLVERVYSDKNENNDKNNDKYLTYFQWRKKRIKKVVQQLRKVKIAKNQHK